MFPWQKEEFNIMHQEKISNVKVLQDGPRFFVAQGRMRGQNIIFKKVLNHPAANLANHQFKKSITILNRIQKINSQLKQCCPQIMKHNTQGNVWFIKKFFPGQPQNAPKSTFFFKKSFFNQNNLQQIIHLFHQLQKHTPRIISHINIKKTFNYGSLEDDLKYQEHFSINRLVGDQQEVKVKKLIKKNAKLVDSAPKVLNHMEPHATHFLKHKKQIHLIDWENVNLKSKARDFILLWLRLFEYPKYQKILFEGFLKPQTDSKKYNAIWHTELLYELIPHVGYFSISQKELEIKKRNLFFNFARSTIYKVLKDYNFS